MRQKQVIRGQNYTMYSDNASDFLPVAVAANGEFCPALPVVFVEMGPQGRAGILALRVLPRPGTE